MSETFALKDVCVGGGSYGIAASAVNYSPSLPTYLRITDIRDDGTLDLTGLKSVDDLNSGKYKLMPNDIVFARTGASTGRNYFYDIRDGEFVYAGFLIKFSIDPEKVNPLYIKYFCRTDDYYNWVQAFDTGGTRGNINAKDLGDMPIPIIPRKQQDFLAEVLSSLDDKINLLKRQNNALLDLAQTYFRKCFIEDANIDWETDTLGNYVDITRGASPRPIIKYVVDGIFPWIKIGDATSNSSIFINQTKEKIIKEGISKSVVAYDGELILSNSATCGLPYILGIDGCIHDGWLIFRNYRVLTKWYVFFLLRSMSREINQQAEGTVQDNLNTSLLKNLSIQIPDIDSIKRFDSFVDSIITKIKANDMQMKNLQKLRDTLLPKLISGEVRVK